MLGKKFLNYVYFFVDGVLVCEELAFNSSVNTFAEFSIDEKTQLKYTCLQCFNCCIFIFAKQAKNNKSLLFQFTTKLLKAICFDKRKYAALLFKWPPRGLTTFVCLRMTNERPFDALANQLTNGNSSSKASKEVLGKFLIGDSKWLNLVRKMGGELLGEERRRCEAACQATNCLTTFVDRKVCILERCKSRH